jgi:hypothetical protein
MDSNRPVVLISCVKSKRDYPCAAKDLYCSPLFKAQRQYAQAVSRMWFILSAKYGLLEPEQQIAPYEMTLKAAPAPEKKRWASDVFTALQQKIVPSDKIVITAGESYCRYLLPLLRAEGFQVERPLKGLSMGFQPGRLKEMVRQAALP